MIVWTIRSMRELPHPIWIEVETHRGYSERCGCERCPDHEQSRIDRDAGLRAILDKSWYPGGPTIRERVDHIGRGKLVETDPR